MDANRIKIDIDFLPGSYAVLSFFVVNVDLGYSKTISKTFTYGTPPSSSWVQITGDSLATLTNLFNNLVANDQDGNMTFSMAADVITINFTNQAVYILTVTSNAGSAFSVTTEAYTFEPPVVPVDTFEMKHLQIQIVDTYENDMPLDVEVTRSNAPVLSYESGDDIYEPLFTSNLKFDMRVPDFGDAHFLHLFTGDENRFKVVLNALNEAEDETRLLWQGFLLPDLMSEPYTNNNLFVNFEAIDMLASLKGKLLKPWEYYQRYNIGILLAKIFALTGVSQPMIIRPSIVPVAAGFGWQTLNVDLLKYVDGDKLTDVYTILTEVLASNLLTCYSYKGYWNIDGVTRKNETTGMALFFDENGVYEGQNTITKQIVQPPAVAGNLNFSAMTPWKTVEAAFNYKGDNNVLPDDVVSKDVFYTAYNNGEFISTSPSTAIVDYWKTTGTKISIVAGKPFLQLITAKTGFFTDGFYNVSAAESLNNYVDLKNPFYLYAGFNYEIEIVIDFRRIIQFTALPEGFVGYPNETFYDDLNKWAQLQVIQNGNEILTNRQMPASTLTFKWQYGSVSYPQDQEQNTISTDVEIKIKKRFVLSESGYANIRFLAAADTVPLGFNITGNKIEMTPKVVKINILNKDIEGIAGTRPVNYTNTLSIPINFISSPDQSIKNNIGLGTQLTPYEETITVGPQSASSNAQYFPNGDVLFTNTWLFYTVTPNMFKMMFKDGRLKSMFVVRASGDEEHFYSWYGREYAGGRVVHYLSYIEQGVIIPDDYKASAKIESGDVLKMALSNYPTENLNNRVLWRIVGQGNSQTFLQSIVLACHCVRPEQLFQMEGTFLDLVWPDQIQSFFYKDVNRNFINTRLTLDLFNGKTSVSGREFKYENLTDVSYE
jgi:hypothetical protein